MKHEVSEGESAAEWAGINTLNQRLALRYRAFVIYGRRGGIRTRDPLHPMQVRYQAALHADKT